MTTHGRSHHVLSSLLGLCLLVWSMLMSVSVAKNPHAFVCLVINQHYAKGCLGLGKSLLHTGSLANADYLVLYLRPLLNETHLQSLKEISPNVVLRGVRRLNLTSHEHYVHSFVKLRCWQQTDYDKIVYLDADVIAMQNLDHLFGYQELGVTQDMYFFIYKTFNSGLLVLKPSNTTFRALIRAARPKRHEKWGDQNFLNEHFASTAVYLPHDTLLLNWMFTVKGLYVDVYWRSAKAIHFAGIKPWFDTSDPQDPKYEPQDRDLIRYPVLAALQNLWHKIYASPLQMSAADVQAMYAPPRLPAVKCEWQQLA